MARGKRKNVARTPAGVDLHRMYGEKPEYKGLGPHEDKDYRTKLHYALNWCSRGLESRDSKKELLFWLKNNGMEKFVKPMRSVSEDELSTAGNLAYLANNGWPLDLGSITYIEKKVRQFLEIGKAAEKEASDKEKRDSKIDELRKINAVSAEVQNIIDAQDICDGIQEIVWNKDWSDDSVTSLTKGAKAVVLNKATDLIREVKAELELFGTDEQVTEGYRHKSKRQITNAIKNIDAAIALMANEKVNKRVIRKPRVKKPKSAAQQTNSLKYQEKDTTLDIVSVDPMTIPGAKKLVVFNTKMNKLGIYYAKDDSGFIVKGTTLQNFDEEKSNHRTVRDTKAVKRADVVRKFRTASIARCDKLFDEIKTLETKLTGRINADTLLLKVYK